MFVRAGRVRKLPNVFLSYRRSDEPYAATLISEQLKSAFGKESVFFDVDDVPYGVDFREYIQERVDRCDVLLVVIGDGWLGEDGSGMQRLKNPSDYVRIEIETALNRDIPVIPLPVRNAEMPTEAELPEAISSLAYRNGCDLRVGPGLIDKLKTLVESIHQLESVEPGLSQATTETMAGDPTKVGGHGMRSIDEIMAFIQDSRRFKSKTEVIKRSSVLLMYRSTTQCTWLVATNERLYCVLEDKTNIRLKWSRDRERTFLDGELLFEIVERDRPTHTDTKLVDIGSDHKGWIYSKSLFEKGISVPIQNLIAKNMA